MSRLKGSCKRLCMPCLYYNLRLCAGLHVAGPSAGTCCAVVKELGQAVELLLSMCMYVMRRSPAKSSTSRLAMQRLISGTTPCVHSVLYSTCTICTAGWTPLPGSRHCHTNFLVRWPAGFARFPQPAGPATDASLWQQVLALNPKGGIVMQN